MGTAEDPVHAKHQKRTDEYHHIDDATSRPFGALVPFAGSRHGGVELIGEYPQCRSAWKVDLADVISPDRVPGEVANGQPEQQQG